MDDIGRKLRDMLNKEPRDHGPHVSPGQAKALDDIRDHAMVQAIGATVLRFMRETQARGLNIEITARKRGALEDVPLPVVAAIDAYGEMCVNDAMAEMVQDGPRLMPEAREMLNTEIRKAIDDAREDCTRTLDDLARKVDENGSEKNEEQKIGAMYGAVALRMAAERIRESGGFDGSPSQR